MSEFDFDELDKAVTRAIESHKQAKAPTSSPVSHEEAAPVEPPVKSSSSDVAVRIVKPEPIKPNPVPNPRTGRSMDIMPPARLDQLANKAEDLAMTEADEQADFEQTEEKFEASPFLPDANQKVAKIPLGKTQVLEDKPEDSQTSSQANDESNELANIDAKADSSPEITPVAGATPDEVLAGLNNNVEQLAPISAPKEAVNVPEVQPSVAKNQDKPKEAGTIYDTENYHKPPQPAVKKNAPLMVTMWVIIILLLVAVASWALWTYVLSNFLVL